jgi:hypothetical protein
VINWFQYPYIIAGGDLRPPLVHEAFVNRFLHTWDEIDFGIPSIYPPRILEPSNFFMTIFQSVGVNTPMSQLMATYLIYLLATILVYTFVKRLTNGDIVAAFIAALFFTSNIHLVVDREQTALGFMDMSLTILPCLVAFTEGLKRKSYGIMAISGILFVLTYGAFPNYRASLLCFFALIVALLFMFFNEGIRFSHPKSDDNKFLQASFNSSLFRQYLKYSLVFILALFIASIWIIVLAYANFNALLGSYSQIGAVPYNLTINLHDALRLIAKWSFYSGAFGLPYTPYATVYINSPLMVVLSYIPPMLALAAILVSKKRKLVIFFGAVAAVSLTLTSGFNPYFAKLYAALTNNFPLMAAFREPTNWIFFVIISFSILIGLTTSVLFYRFKRKVLRIFVISLVVLLFVTTAYPLATGEVTENWLSTNIKGAYLPPSYVQLNSVLSNQYWALLLPQRYTYVQYNFTQGPLGLGNPYPLILSEPIISGLGTEYMQSNNLDLLNKVYGLMLSGGYENVAPLGNASSSSVERDGLVPAQAIDVDYSTRWSSKLNMPQWFEIDWNKTQELSKIRIVFENAYANDYTVETWNGSSWVTQINVKNNNNFQPEYVLSEVTPTTRLHIDFTKASPFNRVSMWELEAYGQSEGVSRFLGLLGIKYLVFEKDLVTGRAYDVSELGLDQNANFVLAEEWNEIALYNNTNTLQKFYPADNILNYTNLDDMYQLVDKTNWNTLQRSAFTNSTLTKIANETLTLPENLVWQELSPTSYQVHVRSKGAFVLVFSESYDSHWSAFVNGKPIAESNHVLLNDFANGWLINGTGNLTITVENGTQNLLTASFAASIILSAVFVIVLTRKTIKEAFHSILSKFKKKKKLIASLNDNSR